MMHSSSSQLLLHSPSWERKSDLHFISSKEAITTHSDVSSLTSIEAKVSSSPKSSSSLNNTNDELSNSEDIKSSKRTKVSFAKETQSVPSYRSSPPKPNEASPSRYYILQEPKSFDLTEKSILWYLLYFVMIFFRVDQMLEIMLIIFGISSVSVRPYMLKNSRECQTKIFMTESGSYNDIISPQNQSDDYHYPQSRNECPSLSQSGEIREAIKTSIQEAMESESKYSFSQTNLVPTDEDNGYDDWGHFTDFDSTSDSEYDNFLPCSTMPYSHRIPARLDTIHEE